MSMAKDGRLVLSLKDLPEVMADMRREMASILREVADDEGVGYTRARLRECAAAFECGQRVGDDAV